MLFSKSLRSFLPFAIAVGVASATASSLAEFSITSWYVRLAKPSWALPSAYFAPIWTGTHAAMALAAWIIYKKEDWQKAQKPLTAWGIQLVLGAFWPGFFFALRRPALAALNLLCLLIVQTMTTLSFARRDRSAGLLMFPACLWALYALALSLTVQP